MKSTQEELNITMHNGTKIKSTQLQPNQATTYLGVTSQVDGDQSAQTSVIKKKANNISKKLNCCHIPYYYGHIYQLSLIIPKLTYPLVASSMSNKQLKSIQSIIHPSVNASKGFNRNWPEELRYDNHKYCGLDLIGFRAEQRLRKIQMLHRLLFNSKHKILMQGIIEWYQILVGLTGQRLANPSINVNYINSIWFHDLLHFVAEFHIIIYTTEFLIVNYQRNNDKNIMSAIGKLHLSKQHNIQINACRLYFQVSTLSDIANPDGRKVNHHCLDGNKPTYTSSTVRWPNRPLPSQQVWHLW